MLLFEDSSLVLLALDFQMCQFERLDALKTFVKTLLSPTATDLAASLVPLKLRIAGASELHDKALGVFIDFKTADSDRTRQQFGVFTVRDGRFVASCEPRVLDHRMIAPTSIDDGQTLFGVVKCDNGRRFAFLLDAQSGEQRALDSRHLAGSKDELWWIEVSGGGGEQAERGQVG